MDVREKLVELIFDSLCRHVDKSCKISENIADDLIAHGVTVKEWISVDERMPEEVGQPVLVLATNCYEQIDIVKAFLDYDSPGFFRTTEKEFDGIWGAWDVTHWMPMPEPPEEGTR